jgi:uncharacterized membrane protein
MIRRSKTPWIYRQSRLLLSVIAGLGLLETTYLSWMKLSGGNIACPTAGCNEVLNSPYATLFGLPITIFGGLAYGTMLLLASIPLVMQSDKGSKKQSSPLNVWSWRLMFILATAMAICSAYLMYLLFFEIQAWCPYCIASALFSATLLILTIIGYPWEDLGQLGLNGLVVAMITLIGILGVYNGFNPTATDSTTGAQYQITTRSGPAELALARHLQTIDAKKYGAYWCPHCQEQKQLFGQQAFAIINYIECDPQGKNPQPQLCQAAGITGYPTWEIQGELYPGRLSLEKLADLSRYSGRRDFQN